MKRRTFLQQAGVLLAGATTAVAAEEEPAQPQGDSPENGRPTVLLTAAESDLGEALTDALRNGFQTRPANGPLVRDDAGSLERLLDGVNAVVYFAPPAEGGAGAELLDRRMRGAYDLLTVAAASGVELVVYLSSLRLVAGYDPNYQVDEDWQPVPGTDPEQLSHYLAEYVCREFARERKLRVIVLRLGEIVHGEPPRGRAADLPWVSQADAVQAVRLALEAHFGARGAGMRPWNVLHIAADVRGGRFPTTRAGRMLGYRPQPGPHA